MAPNTHPPKKTQTSFVDQKSIRNFATASSALTVLLNVIMLVYSQITPQEMSAAILAELALLLCLVYSLSFLKRDPASSISEYVWLTVLNSALLFSSLSGINSILKMAGENYTTPNTAQTAPVTNGGLAKSFSMFNGKTIEAAFGFGDLKNIIFPKQAWFNPTPENTLEAQNLKKEATQLKNQALQTITQTETALNNVINTQNSTHQETDSLSTALHDLRRQYIETLAQVGRDQATIAELNRKLQACPGGQPINDQQSQIDSSKVKLVEQRRQEVLQAHVQKYRMQQQTQQKQHMILQQQHVQQAKYQLQKVSQ